MTFLSCQTLASIRRVLRTCAEVKKVQPTFGIVEFVNNCLLQIKVQKLRSEAGESTWLVQIKQPEASGINARSSCAFANVGDPTSHAGPKANNFLPPRNSLREAKRLGGCGSGHTPSNLGLSVYAQWRQSATCEYVIPD
jgi:hypothetical protein